MAGMVLNKIPKFNSLKFSLHTVYIRLGENYQIVHSMCPCELNSQFSGNS